MLTGPLPDFEYNKVSIPKAEYEYLLHIEKKMEALEGAGLYSWRGHEEALRVLVESEEARLFVPPIEEVKYKPKRKLWSRRS